MRSLRLLVAVLVLMSPVLVWGSILGQVRGVVHDPQHRPLRGARVVLQGARTMERLMVTTDDAGGFVLAAVPLGDYVVSVTEAGFQEARESLTLASNTSALLHFELALETVRQSATVTAERSAGDSDTVTPTTLVSRVDIANTPGAGRTNGLEMITDYVPGAYETHDMLHVRGGHQVTWQIDGVEIPNTNISSNLGAAIDPKDIDYLEVQRGSYTADVGDRTYGVFNVVPRTGFERNREGELVVSAGNFLQTNDQLSLGSHTERFAYYASLSGNRTDDGLSPPVGRVLHDASNGLGGFVSLLYNRTPRDQFRVVTQLRDDFFQIPYDPDPASEGNQQYDSSGLRDTQRERDGLAAVSYIHSFRTSAVLQVSPFFHYNRADYRPGLNDQPVATTSDRGSSYGGLQTSLSGQIWRNNLQGGVYGFGQHDSYRFGSVFGDGSAPDFSIPDRANGGVVEEFVSDRVQALRWLTLIGGVRASQFRGAFSESFVNPRVGAAVQVPRLHWVLRAFYGRFYQPPPLLTASGPVVQYAQSNNTDFRPLHGERDEEHQFGVQIPLRGWLVDADTFKTRANNFLDHSNLGESSLYYPVTVDGALVQAWEVTVRSPRLAHVGQAHLAYSNQIVKQRGAITGGLVCFPVGDPACAADFGYTPVDHDQRNTLNVGFDASLPYQVRASTNVSYGSGFHNGSPNDRYPGEYLPGHTTFDLRVARAVGENTTVSVSALNVANRRVLLDNSLTFGGFHFNDPRQMYAEVRYRFHF